MFENGSRVTAPLPFVLQRRVHGLLVALLVVGVLASFTLLQGEPLCAFALLVTGLGFVPGRPTLVSVAAGGTRPPAAWLDALRALRQGEASYQDAAVDASSEAALDDLASHRAWGR